MMEKIATTIITASKAAGSEAKMIFVINHTNDRKGILTFVTSTEPEVLLCTLAGSLPDPAAGRALLACRAICSSTGAP
ncbi:MAG: hypothetical protein JKY26_06730 [Pseudomonas sp.]|nr:hypothetical protein [Pseudomonas sp.]